ncbi:hypothetical protein [Liquorilactobacillus nagelii]|uniref:hypothetical protein n=1 Tax=Liquorilactobacillus nagelii TaxID=82688 RepID=UPI0039E9686C
MLESKERTVKFNYLMVILFLALSLVAVGIFGSQGRFYSANDLKFHLARIAELVHDLRFHDSFLSPLSFTFFKGTGTAVQIFYPNLTLLPFAFLQLLIKQPIVALYMMLALYSWVGCCLSYFLMLRFTKQNQLQSGLFAVIYNFSLYHTTDLFIRFDLGEWLAMIFLPLVFYGGYQVLAGKWNEWKFGAIGLALVGYSHVLTFALSIGIIMVGWLIGWLLRRPTDLHNRLIAAIEMLGSTFLLTFFEFYPLVRLSLLNNIHFPTRYNLLVSPNGKLPDLNSFLATALSNQLTKNLGIILLLILIGELIMWRMVPKLYRWSWILLVLLVICTTTFFPWQYFQRTPLAVIQFPWRLLTIASFFLALSGSWLFATLFGLITQRWRIKGEKWWGLILVLVVMLPTLSAELLTLNQDKKTDQLVNFNRKSVGTHYWITDQEYQKFVKVSSNTDYYPIKAYSARNSILKRKILTTKGKLRMSVTKFEHNQMTIELISKSAQTANLPWIKYQGINYQLSVNGRHQQLKTSKRGTFLVKLKRGKNKVSLKVNAFTGQFLAEIITVAASACLLL